MIAPIKFEEITDFANAGDYVGAALAQDTTLVLELPGNIQFTPYFELEAPYSTASIWLEASPM